MTSHEQTRNDMTYFTDDLSSAANNLSNGLAEIELNTAQQDMHDFELGKQTLIEECTLWKNQCNDLTMQKQAIEMRSDMLLAESRRLIEEKDNELKYLREITKTDNTTEFVKDENIHLKKSLELQDEQIHTLQLRIKELEDWNGDFQENDSSKIINQDHSALQLNIDLLTSRNSQLESDLQRLQLQQRNNQLALERLDEYEETISQLQEELDQFRSNKKNHHEAISQLLEETYQQLENTMKQSEEKMLKLTEEFERKIFELNEQVQSLENVNYQLQQQLQSRDRQFQTTPGSPPSSTDTRNLSPLNSLYDQFVTLLPTEFSSSDNTHLSLSDRFIDLFEQFSTYIGTFSITQEELDSLKQILNEKQDELEKLRSHLELTTDKLTQLQEEQTLGNKNKSYESDEDELEEILGFQQRAPSLQSLLSITPGEKQQLIAQNELLSSLLTEKERELIELQQADKTREDFIKHLDVLRLQMELEKEVKQVELNDIRNVLDEKLRENSSLKKEKMFFIEKLAEFERERQEQQPIIQIPPKQSTPDREKSPSSIKITEQNIEQTITREEYEKLRSDYDQLLELSTRQHDESLSYYNEYTRILTLYNELTTKYSQLQIDYESIQSLIQQKNEAYLQCQNELNTYQNLLYHQKKKSDDIDLLRSTLNEREIQLQQLIDNENQSIIKQSKLESSLKLLEENNSKLISNQQLFEQIQLDLKRITHERDLAIVEKKQYENQFITKLETFEIEYAKLEEINLNLNEKIKYLENNLEHFQQERDCRINEHLVQYQDSLREQISIIARLTNENNEIRQRLDGLQLDIDLKNKQIIESDENFQTTNNSRVEKQLVKNIILSYFNTPIDKQQEVLPLIGALVGFTQEEYQKAMNAIANNYNTGGSSWLTGWLGSTSSKPKTQSETPVYHPDKSFAELLIQYVDQQSIDNNLQQPILTLTTDKSSESTSDNPTQSIV